jgi:hypothetical protein
MSRGAAPSPNTPGKLAVSIRDVIAELARRFKGSTPEMIDRVLTPYRFPITKIGSEVKRTKSHRYVEFEATIPLDVWSELETGSSGKVVPKEYVDGMADWKELLKARVHSCGEGKICGELHLPGSGRFASAREVVKVGDFVEIDPFGVTSKVESALVEAAFFTICRDRGWAATRMPENVAMHFGTQNYYDFRLKKNSEVVRVELKSLWGTDTTQCRLIHTKSREGGKGKNAARADRQVWRSSSCRFHDQDIFAVNLWLRTGSITDFAYAVSVPSDIDPDWGLPATRNYPEHVVQNIVVSDPPSGVWTPDLETAIDRLRQLRKRSPDLQARLARRATPAS